MDRLEIKFLAIIFCSLVIGLRLPGILWPDKLKVFLARYRSLGAVATRIIGALFVSLGLAILVILFKTITLAKLVVLMGAMTFIGSGLLHFFPETFRRLIDKVERRSPTTLRIVSVLSVSGALGVGIYLLLRG